MSFGDPQWNRWIFVFQVYVLGRSEGEWPSGPDASVYTGIRRSWYSNGRKSSEWRFEAGNVTGVEWDCNRRKWGEMRYVFGGLGAGTPNNWVRHGIWCTYGEDGKITRTCEYRNGEPWDGLCQLKDEKAWRAVYKKGRPWSGCVPADGNIASDDWRYYLEGKELSHSEYCRALGLPDDNYVFMGDRHWRPQTEYSPDRSHKRGMKQDDL